MKKFLFTILFFAGFLFADDALATSYYADLGNAIASSTCGNGLATTTSFCSLDRFTEVARSAGDILFVRRGTATTTGMTDLDFTSDGTIVNPIIIQADYDNLWSDFASTSQTYTFAIGSSTATASANQSDIIVGNWLYVMGDCEETYNNTSPTTCEFAYEVSAVSSTSITFFLPYKGLNAGSGKEIRKMPTNPQWNVVTGNFQWNFDTDNYWKIWGMNIEGIDANGQVEIDSSLGHQFIDCIFIGGVSGNAIRMLDDQYSIIVKKIRTINEISAIIAGTSDTYGKLLIFDSIIQGSAGNNSIQLSSGGFYYTEIYESIIGNSNSVAFSSDSTLSSTITKTRNNLFLATANILIYTEQNSLNQDFFMEDFNKIIGNNKYTSSLDTDNTDSYVILSTSTAPVIRSGGGATSAEVRPTTNFGTKWDFSKIQLFEYPIYADTTNKQYDVYFMSTSTAAWTANPTNKELWIECEYWANLTGTSTRAIKKSTGTVNFTSSSAWQSLSVQCQPTQAGVLYLRGFYGKTKETIVMNQFFMDTTPVISTP